MHTKPRHLPLVLLLVLAGPTLGASPAEEAVSYRQSVMGIFAWNSGRMAAMVKGDVPFDAAAFRGYAAEFAAAAGFDVLKGFPEDSITDDSDAKEEIWMEWADFKAKLEDLRDQSAKLTKAAASADEAAMKAQFDATRGTCKACHKAYKN